jgi:hypothetical protein
VEGVAKVAGRGPAAGTKWEISKRVKKGEEIGNIVGRGGERGNRTHHRSPDNQTPTTYRAGAEE